MSRGARVQKVEDPGRAAPSGACRRLRPFHLRPSEPVWGSSSAGSPVGAFGGGMSGHKGRPGRSRSSGWVPSGLGITRQAHETREEHEERFDRDV